MAMLSAVTPSSDETSHCVHRSRRHSSEPLTVTSLTRNPVSVYLGDRSGTSSSQQAGQCPGDTMEVGNA